MDWILLLKITLIKNSIKVLFSIYQLTNLD